MTNQNHGRTALSNREDKLTVVKSLRMSEVLLRMIGEECKSRKVGFSDYMRDAALTAMKEQENRANIQGVLGGLGALRRHSSVDS